MKNMQLLGLITASILACTGLQAAEISQDLADFSELRLGYGIDATVQCGDQSRIVMRGDEEALATIKIKDSGNTLKLTRKMTSIFGRNRDADISVEITTARSLSRMDASTGSSLEVDECGVSDRELQVEVSTGASLTTSGKTEVLELKVGTGGTFNGGRKDELLSVGKAYVSMSTGSTATLCGAQEVEGKVSTGASVRISKDTEYDLKFGTGATVRTSGC